MCFRGLYSSFKVNLRLLVQMCYLSFSLIRLPSRGFLYIYIYIIIVVVFEGIFSNLRVVSVKKTKCDEVVHLGIVQEFCWRIFKVVVPIDKIAD